MKICFCENQMKLNFLDVNIEFQSKILFFIMINIYMQIVLESKYISLFSFNLFQQFKNVGLGELKEIWFRFQVKVMDNNKRYIIDEILSFCLVFLSFFKLLFDYVFF